MNLSRDELNGTHLGRVIVQGSTFLIASVLKIVVFIFVSIIPIQPECTLVVSIFFSINQRSLVYPL